jgi:translation initiation factor IF-1
MEGESQEGVKKARWVQGKSGRGHGRGMVRVKRVWGKEADRLIVQPWITDAPHCDSSQRQVSLSNLFFEVCGGPKFITLDRGGMVHTRARAMREQEVARSRLERGA